MWVQIHGTNNKTVQTDTRSVKYLDGTEIPSYHVGKIAAKLQFPAKFPATFAAADDAGRTRVVITIIDEKDIDMVVNYNYSDWQALGASRLTIN